MLAEANDPMKISPVWWKRGCILLAQHGDLQSFTEAVEDQELTFYTFSMSGRFSERPTWPNDRWIVSELSLAHPSEGFRQFGVRRRVVDGHITHWHMTTETLKSMPPIGAWGLQDIRMESKLLFILELNNLKLLGKRWVCRRRFPYSFRLVSQTQAKGHMFCWRQLTSSTKTTIARTLKWFLDWVLTHCWAVELTLKVCLMQQRKLPTWK